MSKAAVLLRIRGHVQGVSYRASAQETAKNLGVSGWVRNLNDNSVNLYAEGDRNCLERLIVWCRKGPPFASVSKVEIKWIYPQDLNGFKILH